VHLAGVEGPCPGCFATIQAPIPEARYSEPVSPSTPDLLPVSFPPLRESDIRAIPHLPRLAPADPEFSNTAPDRNFRARLAIPPQDEPLDDSWKDRHRSLRRQNRRARRAEEAAQSFLSSRGFYVARVTLMLLSGAMLVWLYQYLQNHQWRLPGMSPPAVADEKKSGPERVKPVGSNANELMADDDTEIPPASSQQPDRNDPAKTGAQPIAGRAVP
jgi:hypothetical protein